MLVKIDMKEKIKELFDNYQTNEWTIFELEKRVLDLFDVVGRSEQCSSCEESTGETKLWCCNHCGKRIEDW